jgi:hypothetical protein
VKSIVRLIVLVLLLSGWALSALCLYVVRVPDPDNPKQSKLIVVPKNELSINDTYVDARSWNMQEATNHPLLIMRIIYAGKADEMKYLGDPSSKKDMETQLTDALSATPGGPTTKSTAVRTSLRAAGFSH